jgi:hypothetical protein
MGWSSRPGAVEQYEATAKFIVSSATDEQPAADAAAGRYLYLFITIYK